jgi:uncharacterized protein
MSQTTKKLSKREVEKKVEKILAKARREPRSRVQRERDALIDAIRYGHSDIARALLARRVDPNSAEPNGRSALWHAAYWTRADLIRDLVRRGARLPDDVLMGPVYEGDLDTIRFLIRRGANVNCVASYTRYSSKFPQKEVLLSVAIFKTGITRLGYPEAIPIALVKAGAEVNRLALTYSIYEGFIHSVLGLAADNGLVKTVKAMLAAGADANFKDTWGGTALIYAARSGRRDVVRVLLRAGADPDTKRRDGHMAASIARAGGFTELADELERTMKGG